MSVETVIYDLSGLVTGFEAVPNAIINHPGLTAVEKSLLIYLMARPPGWRPSSSQLATTSKGLTVFAVKQAFAGLEAAGYLTRTRIAGERGRFTWLHRWFASPVPPSERTHNGSTIGGLTSDGPTIDGPTIEGQTSVLVITDVVITDVVTTDLENLATSSPTTSPAAERAALAKAVLNTWWERQSPKPGQTYIAALKALEGMLRGGATADELAAFLDAEGAPVSGARLDVWRKLRQRPRPGPSRSEQSYADIEADMRRATRGAFGALGAGS